MPRLDALPLGAHRSLRVLTDEALFIQTGVRIAFTGREGGVSEGPYASLNCATHVEDDPAAVMRNRQIVLEALGARDAPLVVPFQVHGTNIVCVSSSLGTVPTDDEMHRWGQAFPSGSEEGGASAESGGGDKRDLADLGESVCKTHRADADTRETGESSFSSTGAGFGEFSADDARTAAREAQCLADEGADGIVVPMAGVAALLNFADCLSVILVAPSGAFAIAHAGWRGALERIASKAAHALAEATGEDPSHFNAYIGPHIRSECFEVSQDVADTFIKELGVGVLEGDRHVSLAAAVTSDLVSAGLRPERIADARICTKCHPDEYFSYRAAEGRCGRHAAVAIRISKPH